MNRTISGMVGKGSVSHNSRKFNAKNTDPERSHLNVEYCNEPIKEVYHKLFDEALQKYNEKQTRKDRIIPDYYEHILNGKQEKTFHEVIMQIGNMKDTAADSENGKLAKKILDEYYQGFQARNPNLYVFSAHIHMDEATPHIHIDFVPFMTGSKRGLETRVSLKKALTAEGFEGGSRSDTEWNQWVDAEKEQLALVMEKYDINWKQLNSHDRHKSVSEYKKDQLEKEIHALDQELFKKRGKAAVLDKRIEELIDAGEEIRRVSLNLEDKEYQLPEPERFVSAKTYKTKVVEPVVARIKQLIKDLIKRIHLMGERIEAIHAETAQVYNENFDLKEENEKIKKENKNLQDHLKDYKALRRAHGNGKIDRLLDEAYLILERDGKGKNRRFER